MQTNTAKRIAAADKPLHAVHRKDKQARRLAAGCVLLLAAGAVSDSGAPLWCAAALLTAALAVLWSAGGRRER